MQKPNRKLLNIIKTIILIGTIIMLAIAFKSIGMVSREARRCDDSTNMVDFVQVTSARLDAGEQIFEAFRIMQDGMVEWARWSSYGYLIDHAEPFFVDNENFDAVMSSPSFLNPPRSFLRGDVLDRPAFRLDIVAFSGSRIDAVSMNKMPDDIAAISDELRYNAKPMQVQPGWYIWTQPCLNLGKIDMDLTGQRSDSYVASLLSEAVATGRLIVRADERIKDFISGERAYRTAFGARLAKGNCLLFGVLFVK